jgi:hypothetical protein
MAVASIIGLGLAGAAQAQSLTNGGFETGDFTGWTETDEQGGSGSWYVGQYGQGTPLNGFTTPTQSGGGTYFAETDQFGPGSHVLSQTFSAISGQSLLLSFDAYANDQSGDGGIGTGPDYNNAPNQHVAVFVNNTQIYYGVWTPSWAAYSFNISADLVTGINTLSFLEVDDQTYLNEGLDNVQLSGAAVPEPGSLGLVAGGLALVAFARGQAGKRKSG